MQPGPERGLGGAPLSNGVNSGSTQAAQVLRIQILGHLLPFVSDLECMGERRLQDSTLEIYLLLFLKNSV